MESEKQNQLIIPEWLFQEPIEDKPRKIYNPKPLKQIARENIKLDDKQLNKDLAKKIFNPYYFTDRALQIGFNITLDSHNINHANSKSTNKPSFPESGIETRYIKKMLLFMPD